MIKTVVNEEKRTVTAYVTDCQLNAIVRIIKRYPYIDSVNFIDIANSKLNFGLDKAMMNEKYSATVTCDERDVFDPEVGRKLAKEKLVNKLDNATARAIEKWVKHQNSLMNLV